MTIESLGAAEVLAERPALTALLQDAVDAGASIGFLPPLSAADAAAYWDSVAAAVAEGSRLLLVARVPDAGIVGSVQLELATRANARHRAEVVKLVVHRSARRRGPGRALMLAVQDHARALGRTTLVLDTRQGDLSEGLYRSLGWQFAGAIPRYARSADGSLDATAIYDRVLDPA